MGTRERREETAGVERRTLLRCLRQPRLRSLRCAASRFGHRACSFALLPCNECFPTDVWSRNLSQIRLRFGLWREAASRAASRELWLGRLLQGLWSPPVVVDFAVAVLEFSGVGSAVEVQQSLREFSSPGVLFPLQGLQDSLLLLLLLLLRLRKSLTYLLVAGPGLDRAAGGYLCCLLQETPATFFLILAHRPESRSPVLGFYGGRKCTRVLGWWWWWCCCCYSSIIIITIPKK